VVTVVCRTMTKKHHFLLKRVTPSLTAPGDANISDAAGLNQTLLKLIYVCQWLLINTSSVMLYIV